MSAPNIARATFVSEDVINMIAPRHLPLLLAYYLQLRAHSFGETLQRVGNERQNFSPGTARKVELAIILRASLIVMIAEKVCRRSGDS
jgi:hypothetical protein